jgi:UDP-N-acetylmuramoyl-L-alanyl-D-glutamate--2,6-diaminopimelate ligase
LHDVAFHVAVFTTLSHEHIEFHGSFEQYRSDKGNLFRALNPLRRGSFAVLNADDPAMEYFSSLCKTPWYTYGVSSSAGTLTASGLESDVRGSRFTLHWQGQSAEAELGLPGRFHVENVLAALLTVASLTKTSPLELVDALSSLEALPGRFERVAGDQPFSLIVDYAHTPGSFEKLFPFTRRFAAARIITVFGSAGERDVEKRSLQGAIASEYSDIIILTDEDPRDEERMAILDDIARGVEERSSAFVRGESLLLIPDRRKAIRRALEVAQQDDLVLLLGKGHEASIIYPDGPVDWNERAVAEELLREAGYAPEPAGNSAPVQRAGRTRTTEEGTSKGHTQ